MLRTLLKIALASLPLAACASTQINYNALDIASTYDDLMDKQVTFNIQKTYLDPDGLPAFTKITAQSAQTQNSITPTLGLPLSSQISTVAQITQAPTAITNQSSTTAQRAGESLSIAAADEWNQTYSLTPVTDSDQLRRLRVLFQYVTGTSNQPGINPDYELESLYPLIGATGAGAGAGSQETTITITVDGKPVSVKEDTATAGTGKPKITYVRRKFKTADDDGDFNGFDWEIANPDVTFITEPGCVLCDYNQPVGQDQRVDIERAGCVPCGYSKTKRTKGLDDLYAFDASEYLEFFGVHKLEKNKDLRNDWLYAPKEKREAGAWALPSNGVSTIYGKPTVNDLSGKRYFYEFVLFCQDAASQGTGSPATGGQSEGKTPPVQTFSIPVGGNPVP
jgi:hypothetical protein